MKDIALNRDLLNSGKIYFHYGKMMEDVAKGRQDFTPIAIEVHPTAVCNHRCTHCSYKERNESRNSVSKEAMDRLVGSVIGMGIRAVYFSGGGEPTLYPGLKDYIVKLTDNGVECAVISNGVWPDETGMVGVADRLNYAAISVPAADHDTFKAITGTDNFERVLSLPERIRKLHGDKSPIIGSRIVITNQNYSDTGKFLKIIKESGFDYALFKVVRDYEDSGLGLGKNEEEELTAAIGGYEYTDERFTNIKHIFDYRKLPEFTGACWTNRYGMIANVSTDGKVYPNIVEIDHPEFCIGDINVETLEEMWNSERHEEVKRLSDEKWLKGECKNCRAMAYNRLINEMNTRMPRYFDPFI